MVHLVRGVYLVVSCLERVHTSLGHLEHLHREVSVGLVEVTLLGGGGVAGGVVFTLLLHNCLALGHIISHLHTCRQSSMISDASNIPF